MQAEDIEPEIHRRVERKMLTLDLMRFFDQPNSYNERPHPHIKIKLIENQAYRDTITACLKMLAAEILKKNGIPYEFELTDHDDTTILTAPAPLLAAARAENQRARTLRQIPSYAMNAILSPSEKAEMLFMSIPSWDPQSSYMVSSKPSARIATIPAIDDKEVRAALEALFEKNTNEEDRKFRISPSRRVGLPSITIHADQSAIDRINRYIHNINDRVDIIVSQEISDSSKSQGTFALGRS